MPLRARHTKGNMDKIKRTMAMARVSWQVLRSDRELILLPVMSWIFSAILLALIVGPAVIAGQDTWGAFEYVLAGVAYFVVSFVAIFFNVALVHAANERLTGGDPTLKSALTGALDRTVDIAIWAAIRRSRTSHWWRRASRAWSR